MRVLITGGAGYIGSTLAKHLITYDHKITIVDNLLFNQGHLVYPAIRYANFINCDVRDIDKWKNELQKADVIFPLACLVGAPLCEQFPADATQINKNNIQWIVDNISKQQRIIFPNTNSGYGKVTEGVCTEETPLNAVSHYGQLKDDTERYIAEHCQNYVNFRLATVFGWSWRTRLDLLVNTLTYEGFFTRKLKVFDGNFRRNYVHVDDIVDVFEIATHRDKMQNQTYNLGLDEANMTKRDLVNKVKTMLIQYANIDPDIEVVQKTDPDQRDYEVSSEKLKKIGCFAFRPLDSGIRQIIDFCKCLPKDKETRNKVVKCLKNVHNL